MCEKELKFLVIGLGSMGIRRIQNLLMLGIPQLNIYGYDTQESKRKEVNDMYGIITTPEFILPKDMILIISTPPDKHRFYQEEAIKGGNPFFTEASVLNEGLLDTKGVKGVPSCTMWFHEVIMRIKEYISLFRENMDITDITYKCQSWLPDWHKNKEEGYYAFTNEINGCKEMIPFELCWLTKLFGDIKQIESKKSSTKQFGDFDDYYKLNIEFENNIKGDILIDVITKEAKGGNRQFNITTWDAVYLHNLYSNEAMYVREMKAFIDYVEGVGEFPHTFEEDQKLLEITEEVSR